METYANDLVSQLIEALNEIMEVEDEKFNLTKDFLLQTITTNLTGSQADNAISKAIAASKALGVSRLEMVKQNEAMKNAVYALITQEYKPRYLLPAKQEFLDSFYSLIEDYANKTIEFWDLDTPTIYIEKLEPKAKLPTYASAGDQGADVYAYEDITIPANSFGTIVHLGIAAAIPYGWALAVRPRSGMSVKTHLRISNAPGTIKVI